MKKFTKSENYHKKALEVIPGGVNSPARALIAVGRNPIYIKSAKKAYIKDIDGNKYIDYVMSWGPIILGHSYKAIRLKAQKALKYGTSFGAPTISEFEFARLITKIFPAIEKVRLVNSGTEAVMSAIRLARGYTNRPYIVKFEGCYHGHCDFMLVSAGSGAQSLGIPNSKGVPIEVANLTLIAQFNDKLSVEKLFNDYGNKIAAVIVEPIIGNMGVIKPKDGFLEFLREITTKYNSLLIFDEVITGFRVALGGASELYNIKPDLITLGKILGGGFPIGAYGGKKEIMSCVAPEGEVYQAGTLSGNPISVAAGLASIRTLNQQRNRIYPALEEKGAFLENEFLKIANEVEVDIQINRVGSMFTVFFTNEPVYDAKTAKKSDTKKFAFFFNEMLKEGIYLAPSQFEANFISYAHDNMCLKKTVKAFKNVLIKLKEHFLQ